MLCCEKDAEWQEDDSDGCLVCVDLTEGRRRTIQFLTVMEEEDFLVLGLCAAIVV